TNDRKGSHFQRVHTQTPRLPTMAQFFQSLGQAFGPIFRPAFSVLKRGNAYLEWAFPGQGQVSPSAMTNERTTRAVHPLKPTPLLFSSSIFISSIHLFELTRCDLSVLAFFIC